MAQLAQAPGMHAPWMKAMETQLEAFKSIERFGQMTFSDARRVFVDRGFAVDLALLKNATPFAWSKETVQATLAASKSIPLDTKFNSWNLNTSAVWWWFDEPLPFKTVEVDDLKNEGVRVICFGWVTHPNGYPCLACSTWCDAKNKMPNNMTITPSQTWMWDQNQTLEQMLQEGRRSYMGMYEGNGVYAKQPHVGIEPFILATEGLSRFILAGLAWLGQKILVESEGHIERHRRKDFNRQTKQDIKSVKIISLRRIDRKNTEEYENNPELGSVEWSCRWTVDGHFRNQACGVGMKDRRLVWISPYIKGPDDKELRIPKQKVYVVNR